MAGADVQVQACAWRLDPRGACHLLCRFSNLPSLAEEPRPGAWGTSATRHDRPIAVWRAAFHKSRDRMSGVGGRVQSGDAPVFACALWGRSCQPRAAAKAWVRPMLASSRSRSMSRAGVSRSSRAAPIRVEATSPIETRSPRGADATPVVGVWHGSMLDIWRCARSSST